MHMYFIALVAPDDINQRILKWKLWMKEKYDCEAALRSPAHITLVPPFWMQPALENDLSEAMGQFSETRDCFHVNLNNFDHFGNKVIFIDVTANEQLTKLQMELFDHFGKDTRFPFKKDERPFHPHVSIAFRDLYKKAFLEAWEHFKGKKYSSEWVVKGIALLRHSGVNWEAIASTTFGKTINGDAATYDV